MVQNSQTKLSKLRAGMGNVAPLMECIQAMSKALGSSPSTPQTWHSGTHPQSLKQTKDKAQLAASGTFLRTTQERTASPSHNATVPVFVSRVSSGRVLFYQAPYLCIGPCLCMFEPSDLLWRVDLLLPKVMKFSK